MVEILAGIISGVVSGLGMGGGTILILVLSIFLGMNQHSAQATNLIFFIPTSIIAITMNLRSKLINWKAGITVAVFGIIGAIIGANIAVNMDVKYLRKLFGAFLIIIAIYQIYSMIKQYKFIKNSNNKLYKIGG